MKSGGGFGVGQFPQSLIPLILILSTPVHNNDVVAGQLAAAPCRYLVRLSGKMASLARIAAVAQSWLDRKETLPEATAFSETAPSPQWKPRGCSKNPIYRTAAGVCGRRE